MSIQVKKYKSKKTGKTIKKYYAVVFDPKSDSAIWGKGREKRSDAVLDEAKLLDEIARGIGKVNHSGTFSEVSDLWFDSMENTYAEATYDCYQSYNRKHLIPMFGNTLVSKITPLEVQRLKNKLSKAYKPATVNKTMYLLSMIMEFAINPLEMIKYNPCANIKRDKVMPINWTTWDEKAIGYFLSLEIIRESDYYEMLCVSFTTAMRPGEVCGIWASDLQPDGTLVLHRGFNKFGNITDMKTSGSHRPIGLDPFVHNLLLEKIQKKKQQEKEFKKKLAEIAAETGEIPDIRYHKSNFIFTYPNGDPITPNSYSRAFRSFQLAHKAQMDALKAKHGKLPVGNFYLPKIRLYDGRHSFATNTIVTLGENPKVISDIMGSSVTTIMKNYVHTADPVHKETLSKYSSKLFTFENKNEKDLNQ